MRRSVRLVPSSKVEKRCKKYGEKYAKLARVNTLFLAFSYLAIAHFLDYVGQRLEPPRLSRPQRSVVDGARAPRRCRWRV